jgi:hypothetical protein
MPIILFEESRLARPEPEAEEKGSAVPESKGSILIPREHWILPGQFYLQPLKDVQVHVSEWIQLPQLERTYPPTTMKETGVLVSIPFTQTTGERTGPVTVTSGGTFSVQELIGSQANFLFFGQGEDPPTKDTPFEDAFQRIGWWKGSHPIRELQREDKKFWENAGEKGIRWLVRRLRGERNIEVLHGAASLLASIGPAIVLPILDELDRTGAGDNGLALLGALGKLPADSARAHQTRLSNTLRRYLGHHLLDLREAAAAATAILPRDHAIRMLKDALRKEPNPVGRATLEDAIADRQEEQD